MSERSRQETARSSSAATTNVAARSSIAARTRACAETHDPFLPRPPASRATGIGRASADDPCEAATAAVEQALDGRSVQPGDVVLLFSAGFEDPARAFVCAQEVAAPARVAGCSSDGAFTAAGDVATGFCAVHLASERMRLGLARCELGDDLAGAARRAAESARNEVAAESAAGHAALLLLSDGLAGDQREIVRGAYEVTGAPVPIVGGAAGDDLRIRATWQYAAGASANSVVALWIECEQPVGVGVAHGWRPASPPMLVTRAEGNVILELEGRPARDAYLEARACSLPDDQPFATFAMDHPLGIPNARGGYDVRHIMGPAGSGLAMFAYVPESTVVQVMEASAEELLDGAEEAARQARDALHGVPATVLAFSCAARKAIFGAATADEPQRLALACGTDRLCGFFTYGEFGRVTGSTGFHNASVSVLALPA